MYSRQKTLQNVALLQTFKKMFLELHREAVIASFHSSLLRSYLHIIDGV